MENNEQLNPKLLKVMQEAEKSKEDDLKKVKEEIKYGYPNTPEMELILRIVANWGNAIEMPNMEGWVREYAEKEKLTIDDYEEVLADHRRLVRELDVVINGKNAAKQASLVDMVRQIRDLWPMKELTPEHIAVMNKTADKLFVRDKKCPKWVKANGAGIKDGHYVAKYKPCDMNLLHEFVGMAFVDADYIRFSCPPQYDIKWHKRHEELQYLSLLDESEKEASK